MRHYVCLIAFFLMLSGCGDDSVDRRPDALGPEGEITVVVDSTTWGGPVGDAVREVLAENVLTLPRPEPLFQVQRTNLNSRSLDTIIKKRKYVLIAGVLGEDTSVGRFLAASLDSAATEAVENGRNVVVQRDDLWYQNQVVVYAVGPNPASLASRIYNAKGQIQDAFTTQIRQNTEREMFKRRRQTSVEESMMGKHGFALNVQHDYLVPTDTTDFVWLRRVLQPENWRSVFVHYIDNADPSLISPTWIQETRNALTEEYVQGNVMGYATIDNRRPLQSENVNFLGRFGYETRGLWHMVGEIEGRTVPIGGGGPFVNYTFYDEAQQRIYMIDGMLFLPNPKYDKREFVRQLDVIAHTFRTAGDEMAAQGDGA